MLAATMTKTIFGIVLSISALVATQASADATLDRIKGRGKLTVGVILSGAPFGYIDPKTQEQKGLTSTSPRRWPMISASSWKR